MPSCQSSKPILILEYNMTYYSDLPSNNNEKSISLKILNNGKKGIWPTDTIGNDNEDIKQADID